MAIRPITPFDAIDDPHVVECDQNQRARRIAHFEATPP
jgi:hypothetical protein